MESGGIWVKFLYEEVKYNVCTKCPPVLFDKRLGSHYN